MFDRRGVWDYIWVTERSVPLFLMCRGDEVQGGGLLALGERSLSYALALLLYFRSFNLHIS